MQGASATNLPGAQRIVGPPERNPSLSRGRHRAVLGAVCWMLIALFLATPTVAGEANDLSIASAVVHLNGVRIHSTNCGKPPDENLEQQLAAAIGITQSRRLVALREYVARIYSNMIATAAKECIPDMLDAYSQGFREKLDEMAKVRRGRN